MTKAVVSTVPSGAADEAQDGFRTERLVLRRMVRADLDQIQTWRPFHNPLSPTWNLRWYGEADMNNWIRGYENDPSRLMFAVALHDGQVIGRLSLRQIRPGQSAVLGIALGAPWVSHGYGTEILQGFMPFYFNKLGFQVLRLDVAAPNMRAVRCYEKVGFVKTGESFRSVTAMDARAFMETPEYAAHPQFLRRRFGQNMMLFYDMELSRERWAELPSHTP